LAACAFALDKQLNKVDLPTFGSPTIPHFNAIFFYKRLYLGAKVRLSEQKSKYLATFCIFTTSNRQSETKKAKEYEDKSVIGVGSHAALSIVVFSQSWRGYGKNRTQFEHR
jgi:hypothetical protein